MNSPNLPVPHQIKRYRKLLLSGLFSSLITLAGCGDMRVQELKPGIATEADVRSLLGSPTEERTRSDGVKVLEFARGPQGHETYIALLDSQHILISITQVLNEKTFATLKIGMTQDQVREIIGHPSKIEKFPRQQDEIWSWKYMRAPAEAAYFGVHFDPNGQATHFSQEDAGAQGGSH